VTDPYHQAVAGVHHHPDTRYRIPGLDTYFKIQFLLVLRSQITHHCAKVRSNKCYFEILNTVQSPVDNYSVMSTTGSRLDQRHVPPTWIYQAIERRPDSGRSYHRSTSKWRGSSVGRYTIQCKASYFSR
jgi:hypothetical protein